MWLQISRCWVIRTPSGRGNGEKKVTRCIQGRKFVTKKYSKSSIIISRTKGQKRDSWTMTRVVSMSTPSQLARNGPTVWGDGWKSQEARTHLVFSCNWKEKSQISSRHFLLLFYSWMWCSVLSTVEMSHCLLFRARLYISYICDHMWNW